MREDNNDCKLSKLFARKKKIIGDDEFLLLPLNEILLATVLALNNYEIFFFSFLNH